MPPIEKEEDAANSAADAAEAATTPSETMPEEDAAEANSEPAKLSREPGRPKKKPAKAKKESAKAKTDSARVKGKAETTVRAKKSGVTEKNEKVQAKTSKGKGKNGKTKGKIGKTKRAKTAKTNPDETLRAELISSEVVYQGPLFRVMHDKLLEPGGKPSERDVIRHHGSVVILAIDNSKSKKNPYIVVERQYRHAANRYLWELPAGKLDEGEDALAGAKRELAEETGYAAKKWKPLVEYFASPGFLGESMKVFTAEGLIAGDAHPEADEEIEFRLVKFSEILKMIEQRRHPRRKDPDQRAALCAVEEKIIKSLQPSFSFANCAGMRSFGMSLYVAGKLSQAMESMSQL